MVDQFRRKTAEEILQSISAITRGRLKIILGAVSGSGKTYDLLQEGNDLKAKGIDVVIGLIGAAERPEAFGQMGALECIPAIDWNHKGKTGRDLDMAALYIRHPEVVLVDELARKNRPAAANRSRVEDVMELVGNGISVITTMNIYELTGVKEAAERVLKHPLPVSHTVPAGVLSEADEVRLLDVTPEAVLKRLHEGRMQDQTKGKPFFEKEHLAVLRELSLRFLAAEVDDDLNVQREQEGLSGPSGAAHRVLVCVQYHLTGSILIRRGNQIAKRLGGVLFVASFIPSKKKYIKEEQLFRKSIKKLIKKLEGQFEEIIISKKEIAEEIVEHAIRNHITQIVLGQSKQTRREEIIRGSIVNKILRKSKHMDVLLVADIAEASGERVIPAYQPNRQKHNPYRRLSAEERKEKILGVKKGNLKVYIGAAPGVGKTYTMLREANQLKNNAIDVVIGLLETHGRKETADQVREVDIIPRRQIAYKNVTLEEMDLDAILDRNPEVVLVDELAHTNVPGSKNKKRYQDVMEILDAGISVISTMNIQHVESLNDTVQQITGVLIRETVPDQVLHAADELQLIDISPKALIQRMLEGNIYTKDKIEQSLTNFFKIQNLIALRELALRELADEVDEKLESLKRREGVRGPWRREETIVVCVNLRKDSERLIRRAFRMAYRLKADWHILYVKDKKVMTEDQEEILNKIKLLAERLGGNFELHDAPNRRGTVDEIIKQLEKKKATQVIIGHSARTRRQEIVEGSVVERLLRKARHLDILVVAD